MAKKPKIVKEFSSLIINRKNHSIETRCLCTIINNGKFGFAEKYKKNLHLEATKMNIKKILFFFIFIVNILNFAIIPVDAATGTVTMTANKSQIVVGNTVTYTVTVKAPSNKKLGVFQYYISYDSSMLSLTSGESSGAPVFTGSESSKTYTFKFKAKKAGTATVKFNVSGGYTFDQEKLTLSSPSKRVTNSEII